VHKVLPPVDTGAPTALSVASSTICFSELARPAVALHLVRVDRIVMLKPAVERAEHGCRIGNDLTHA